MFSHKKEDVVSPYSSILDALTLFPDIDMEDVWNCEDSSNSDWISYEDPDQGYVKVEFAASMPPNMPKVEAHASNPILLKLFSLCPLCNDLMQIVIWGLNKLIVARMISYACGISCTPIVDCRIN